MHCDHAQTRIAVSQGLLSVVVSCGRERCNS